jgi:hypothetical protein
MSAAVSLGRLTGRMFDTDSRRKMQLCHATDKYAINLLRERGAHIEGAPWATLIFR